MKGCAKIEGGWLINHKASNKRRKAVYKELQELGYSREMRGGIYHRMIIHDTRRAMKSVIAAMMLWR